MQYLTLDKVNEINVDLNEHNTVEFLCLNETFINSDALKQIVFDDFNLGTYYCRNNYYGGGCAIWVRRNISFRKICLDNFSTDKDLEVCGLSFKKSINRYRNTEFILLLIYRSPSGNENTFFEHFYDILNYIYINLAEIYYFVGTLI